MSVLTSQLNIEELLETEITDASALLYNSEIGNKYYPSQKVLEKLIKDSFGKDKIYKLAADDEIVGILWYLPVGAFSMYPYLHMIFVKDEYRKKGAGKKMLDFFENQALNAEGNPKIKNKVFLVVGAWNTYALNFYERLGYNTIGTIPGLFRKQVDEILMMKECVRQNLQFVYA